MGLLAFLLISLLAFAGFAQTPVLRPGIEETYQRLKAEIDPALESPTIFNARRNDADFQRSYTAYQRLARLRMVFISLNGCAGLEYNPFTTELRDALEQEVVDALCAGTLETQHFPTNFNSFRNDLGDIFSFLRNGEQVSGDLKQELIGNLIGKFLETKFLIADGGPLPSTSSMRSQTEVELCEDRSPCPFAALIDREITKLRQMHTKTLDKRTLHSDLASRIIPGLNDARFEAKQRIRSERQGNQNGGNQRFSMIGHQAYHDYASEYQRLMGEGPGSILLAAKSLATDYAIEDMEEIAEAQSIIEAGSDQSQITSVRKNLYSPVSLEAFDQAIVEVREEIKERIESVQDSDARKFQEELLVYHPQAVVDLVRSSGENDLSFLCPTLQNLQRNNPDAARAATQRLYTALAIGGGVAGAVGGFLVAGPGGSVAMAIAVSGGVASVLSLGVGVYNLKLTQDHQNRTTASHLLAQGDGSPFAISQAWQDLETARTGVIIDAVLLPLEVLGLSSLSHLDEAAQLRRGARTARTSRSSTNLLSGMWDNLDEVMRAKGLSRGRELSAIDDVTLNRFFARMGKLAPEEVEQVFANLGKLHSQDLKGFFWYLDFYKDHDENFSNALAYFSKSQDGLSSTRFTESWWDRARLSYYEHMGATYNNPRTVERSLRASPVQDLSLHYNPYPATRGPRLMGDFSATFQSAQGHTFMLVGDAQGHGQAAARLSTYVSEILHTDPAVQAMFRRGESVDVITNYLHTRLAQLNDINDAEDYVSFSIARIAPNGRQAQTLSVENNPIVLRQNSTSVDAQMLENDQNLMKLGMRAFDEAPGEALRLRPHEVTLRPGDRLIMDTDGISENAVDLEALRRRLGDPNIPADGNNLRHAPADFDFERQEFVRTGRSNYERVLETGGPFPSSEAVRDHILRQLGTADDDQYLWVLGF